MDYFRWPSPEKIEWAIFVGVPPGELEVQRDGELEVQRDGELEVQRDGELEVQRDGSKKLFYKSFDK